MTVSLCDVVKKALLNIRVLRSVNSTHCTAHVITGLGLSSLWLSGSTSAMNDFVLIVAHRLEILHVHGDFVV